jgi:3-keto-disaccharide hydrolase
MRSLVTGSSALHRTAAAIGCLLVAILGASPGTAPRLFAQAQGNWKPLFNGKDFSGWTALAGGRGRGAAAAGQPATPPAVPPAAPSVNPEDRGWKVENGVITSAPPATGQRQGSLATTDKFKDFELEFDFMLAEAGTRCTPKLGEKQANLSEDKTCTFNSGVTFRNGYQLNLGRREAGEYIGVVVHRTVPEAIRGNVDWLSSGDCGAKNNTYLEDCDQFPMIRKKGDWNHVRISFKGPHLQVWLNGKQISDVTDDPTDPAETSWKEAAPFSFQWPPAGESGGFAGTVKYRNIRAREL